MQKRVQSLVDRLARLNVGLPELTTRLVAESRESLERRRAAAASNLEHAHAEAGREFTDEDQCAQVELSAALETLAPGSAMRAWDAWIPEDTGVLPASTIRIGTIQAGADDPMPALVPLLDTSGWYVECRGVAGTDLAKSAVLRVAAETPAHLVSVNVFDPRLSGAFGQFTGLRKIRTGTFPPPRNDPGSFREAVDRNIEVAGHNAELIVSSGASSLTHLWHGRPSPEGVQQVLVVLDYPFGVDEELQRRLVHAASVAGPNGLALIVVADPAVSPTEKVEPSKLAAALRRIGIDGDRASVQGLPEGVNTLLDAPPSDEIARAVIGLAAKRADDTTGPVIRLSELIAPELQVPWTWSSDTALDVPIGKSGGEVTELSIRTENPPFPNLLIGGAVGQGKSNLLLTFIYGMASRYSPDDVALYLLDFKQGLEFKRFDADDSGENWLPHVRVLGLESNNAFGLAVLQHVFDAMEKRAEAFKRVGANSIDAYRKVSGKPLPRLVVVIDEFQVMFDGELDEVEPQINLLEQIAKLGRAYGIHLVLASQAMTGIRSLASKGSSIFSQFPLRVSLKNTPEESQAFLSMGNKAASELTFRGEAVVNRNFGGNPEHDNERVLVAWAEPETVESLQRDLWRRDARERPVYFVGKAAATWDESSLPTSASASDRSGIEVWVGRPIAVTQEPRRHRIGRDADQAIAVIGSDQSEARMALHTLLSTALPGLVGGRLTVVDGADETSSSWFVDVRERAAAFDVGIEVIDRADGARYLRDTLGPVLDDDADSELVVILGVQRLPGMEDDATGIGDNADTDDDGYLDFSDPVTARSVVADLAKRGAMSGRFFVGWWNNLRGAESDLGPDLPGASVIVTVGLPQGDLRALGGVSAPAITESPRIGLIDRSTDGVEVLVPYSMFIDDVAPSDEEELV